MINIEKNHYYIPNNYGPDIDYFTSLITNNKP